MGFVRRRFRFSGFSMKGTQLIGRTDKRPAAFSIALWR